MIVHVSRSDRMHCKASSGGNQIKWKRDKVWIKKDLLGYESVAEVAVTQLLRYTDLPENAYVTYYPCSIVEDGVLLGSGCYSYNFVPMGYEEITVGDILEENLESFSIEYEDLRMLLYDYLKHDPKKFLDRILCVDAIVRNCDRHFNNIVLLHRDGEFVEGPLFDYGDSCLSDLVTTPIETPFEIAYDSTRYSAKPFKCEFLRNLVDNEPLRIRYIDYLNSVVPKGVYETRALATIMWGLKETEGKAWVRL